MSRLGKQPIPLPKGVECKLSGKKAEVKGPKGVLSFEWPEGIDVVVDEGHVLMTYKENPRLPRPMYGLYRSLLANTIIGVSEGFVKKLTLIGVGYRAAVKGNAIELQLGFSKPRELAIPQGIEVNIEKSTSIAISGVDKQLVGQFAANIRSLRPPEPYKGKGVRYENEYVRKKAGKAAKG